MRRSGVAHTKSISNAANNQALIWTIGSKRNANSNAGCFAARRRARTEIRRLKTEGAYRIPTCPRTLSINFLES
jgi:hypothetical protein